MLQVSSKLQSWSQMLLGCCRHGDDAVCFVASSAHACDAYVSGCIDCEGSAWYLVRLISVLL